MNEILFRDLGNIEYKEAYDIQKQHFDNIIKSKINNTKLPLDTIFFCEHPHVFTLGKSGKSQNLLVNESWLKLSGVSYFKTDRGGDITYHGPGQIVCYPIINLDTYSFGIKEYINKLEKAIINSLSEYSIVASMLIGSTGVWLDVENNPKKICAIGVKASRHVTMHGFALNVKTDLDYFNKIIPCGISDKQVTSLAKELNTDVSIEEVKTILLKNLSKEFNWKIIEQS